MKIKFYGTRGSTPVSDKKFVEYGGNTSCILVTLDNNTKIIFDAGTGIRQLGNDLLEEKNQNQLTIVLSHFHWDHIQGFPFFAPAYIKDYKIMIAICGKDRVFDDLVSVFSVQMQSEYFPVPLDKMGAKFEFFQPDTTEYKGPQGNKWEFYKHNHPGGAYSYRYTADNKTFVYCTDIEHGEKIDENIVELARSADLLVHDSQYTPEELNEKKGWGHSSCAQAVEVAKKAKVKRLALFHHDPDHNDDFLRKVEKHCKKNFPNSFFAKDGLEIQL